MNKASLDMHSNYLLTFWIRMKWTMRRIEVNQLMDPHFWFPIRSSVSGVIINLTT